MVSIDCTISCINHLLNLKHVPSHISLICSLRCVNANNKKREYNVNIVHVFRMVHRKQLREKRVLLKAFLF